MKIVCWYKNGSIETLSSFCNQNQDKPISVKLTNRQECVEGKLHSYDLDIASGISGIFILLTDRVIHPAYYGLDGIECLHIGSNEARSPFADGTLVRDESAMIADASGC